VIEPTAKRCLPVMLAMDLRRNRTGMPVSV
jgi:hypothetical protein